ncbi:wound-induced protein 1-like [Senna tora]|uniref:Wound-induced protein 1-like n=1 Tax=Senna tora TaxID=362788 RepID=A0A834T749_9FABA|nr:wound-induced protein 1-like [Senna tora]
MWAQHWLKSQELANSQASLEDGDSSSKRLVVTLYEALNSADSDTVVKIVATDLEWWFHGPPSHQFLMRMLTGQTSSFRFIPQSITCFGPTVLVEGCDNSRSISWVHALTLSHGIITQIREYFNTSLTVTRFAHSDISAAAADSLRCPCLWESSVSDRVGKSVPGLVLAL